MSPVALPVMSPVGSPVALPVMSPVTCHLSQPRFIILCGDSLSSLIITFPTFPTFPVTVALQLGKLRSEVGLVRYLKSLEELGGVPALISSHLGSVTSLRLQVTR